MPRADVLLSTNNQNLLLDYPTVATGQSSVMSDLPNPWADKREEGSDTQPICLFQKGRLAESHEREENYGACPPSLSLEMADITSPPSRKFFEHREKNF
jgi:hypothetical protein